MSSWINYLNVKSAINSIAAKIGRNSEDIKIVAVSKKIPAVDVQKFINEATCPIILGESYVQEFLEKSQVLKGRYESHLIGPLQSNKVKLAVGRFDIIQSVHSMKIAQMISKRASELKITQRIFLQVNISADPAKKGFLSEEICKLYGELSALPGVSVEGLMTITFDYEDPESARPDFIALRELRNSINPDLRLSMGMSADYEIAVSEGADLIRVGTAIFGERSS